MLRINTCGYLGITFKAISSIFLSRVTSRIGDAVGVHKTRSGIGLT